MSDMSSRSMNHIVTKDGVGDLLSNYPFPSEFDIPVTSETLKTAVYAAFDGRCQYTGVLLDRENMVIDHVIPKSLGGPDNIYNYALASKSFNKSKLDKLMPKHAAFVLYAIAIFFAPKVIAHMEAASELKVRKLSNFRGIDNDPEIIFLEPAYCQTNGFGPPPNSGGHAESHWQITCAGSRVLHKSFQGKFSNVPLTPHELIKKKTREWMSERMSARSPGVHPSKHLAVLLGEEIVSKVRGTSYTVTGPYFLDSQDWRLKVRKRPYTTPLPATLKVFSDSGLLYSLAVSADGNEMHCPPCVKTWYVADRLVIGSARMPGPDNPWNCPECGVPGVSSQEV